MPEAITHVPKRVLLAAPRGYCAGVDRAVQTVEHALDLHGAPVYVRKEIVHNKHVVQQFSERGAIFVDEETEVPEGALVVFSAHGVSPAVHANAAERRLYFRYPVLPEELQEVQIQNLQLGAARVDLSLHRYAQAVGVNVIRREGGPVEIVAVK